MKIDLTKWTTAPWWGWVVVTCSLVQFVLVIGILFGYSEMLVTFSEEFHSSETMLDWVGATSVFFPMAAAPIALTLNEAIGARPTVMIGVFISSLGLAFTGLVKSVMALLFTYGFVFGIGATFILNPPFILIDQYFPLEHSKHVLATSIGTCAYPLGVLIFNPFIYQLLHVYGWKITYTVLAIMVFIIGCATTFTYVLPPPRSNVNGIPPPRNSYSDLDKQSLVDETNEAPLSRKTKCILGGCWFVASTLKAIGYYTPFLILVKHMTTLGIKQSDAAKGMVVISSTELVIRLVTSILGDRIKGRFLYVYIGFCVLLSLENGLGALGTTFDHMVIFGAAIGICGGPIIAALYSACAEVMGEEHVPLVFSIARFGFGVGCLFGPLIAGAIFDANGSYHNVFYLNCGIYLASSIVYAIIIIINKLNPLFVKRSRKKSEEAALCQDMELRQS